MSRRGLDLRGPRKRRLPVLNVTSLIDVMFLLLIFFMVTSTFRNQPAINLVLPRSTTAVETVDTPTIVFLTADGQVFLNDALVPQAELAPRLTRLHASTGDDRLVLRADENAFHGAVIGLMDVIQESGFTRISFSARSVESR